MKKLWKHSQIWIIGLFIAAAVITSTLLHFDAPLSERVLIYVSVMAVCWCAFSIAINSAEEKFVSEGFRK